MELDVKTKTQDAANLCKNNCRCQSDGGRPDCAIINTVNSKVFFTEGRPPCDCPYQHSYGSAFMCMCPVRQDIYLKHKV